MVDAYGLDFELELQKVNQTSYALEALLKGTVPRFIMARPRSIKWLQLNKNSTSC
jgi:hypothetical protein